MAPEVGSSRSYDLSADVYSFGVLLWEICALTQPFSNITTMKQYYELIVKEHHRPKLSAVKHHGLRKLIAACWSANPASRPTFTSIIQQLELLCGIVDHEKKTNVVESSNNSVFRFSATRRTSLRKSLKLEEALASLGDTADCSTLNQDSHNLSAGNLQYARRTSGGDITVTA